MATLKEEIVAQIKPCCRNRVCAEQAADVAIKMVKEKLKSIYQNGSSNCAKATDRPRKGFAGQWLSGLEAA